MLAGAPVCSVLGRAVPDLTNTDSRAAELRRPLGDGGREDLVGRQQGVAATGEASGARMDRPV
jgi:hypothetical protein